MQGMEVANIMRICASLVDRDYYSMIRTIIGSPMVDMYQDGVWIPVRSIILPFLMKERVCRI